MTTTLRHQRSFEPKLTICDPPFSPAPSFSPNLTERPVGSRYEVVPHEGSGTASYVRQPTRAELVRFLPCTPFVRQTTFLTSPFLDVNREPTTES